jgi:branched-chain amino acid transport system substrate-binding protein
MSVWASAVGSAVLPLCWENKVMMLAISAADSIARCRTRAISCARSRTPNCRARSSAGSSSAGAKSVYLIMPQTPFTETVFKAIRETVEPEGVKVDQRDHRQQEDLVPLRDRRDGARESRTSS